MNYRVILVPRADRDVREIHGWISDRSATGADAWLTALNTALGRLQFDPNGFALAAENDVVPIEVREFSFKTRRGRTYRGVFRVIEDAVYVLHVRGPGQQLLRPEDFEE